MTATGPQQTITVIEQVTVCGIAIQFDKSGVGHCWVDASEYNCPEHRD